jgi:hypothetical protein
LIRPINRFLYHFIKIQQEEKWIYLSIWDGDKTFQKLTSQHKKIFSLQPESDRSSADKAALKILLKKFRKSKCLEGLQRAITSEDVHSKCVIYNV